MRDENMTVVNFQLGGELEKKVQRYIKSGYATSKAEVIRVALTSLEVPVEFEDVSDDPELERYLLDVQSGKIKPEYLPRNYDLRKLMKKR